MATGMKCSLSGMTRNAAERIEGMASTVKAMMSEDEYESFCMEHQPADSAFMLRELSKHAAETAKGKHGVAEFAEFYCIAPEK